MKYFLDTEFMEEPGYLQLLSIGVACNDGRCYYAISREGMMASATRANSWVKENVLPKLKAQLKSQSYRAKSVAEIRADLLKFVDHPCPEFWGYFADYDWVLFCWIFGAMVDLPKGWPMYCRDLKQLMAMSDPPISRDDLPPNTNEHDALADAKWVKSSLIKICNIKAQQRGQ